MSIEEARGLISALADREPPQALSPKRPPDESVSAAIRRLTPGDAPEARALRSALLLWNDDLDGSHALSQELHTPTGSLLHGIMHRMEGDYWNADYWFRRVGAHPCYADIAREAALAEGVGAFVVRGDWDPSAFNRAVERALQGGDAAEIGKLERLQRAEMTAVARYCLHQCFGGTSLG
ncbi:hypothetical protein [Paenibacillus sp.]|uniref:hypothetical protein n=1 Tax=Paenibacillus sp. TaxID=58172 RepID=UPI002811B780|nr:hypothetical protein [Paenibacillus sp.]